MPDAKYFDETPLHKALREDDMSDRATRSLQSSITMMVSSRQVVLVCWFIRDIALDVVIRTAFANGCLRKKKHEASIEAAFAAAKLHLLHSIILEKRGAQSLKTTWPALRT